MKKRILLVEDEESLQDVIKMNLELEGYDTHVADTGQKAVDKFEHGRYDLVLLDVMLPEMDGFEVCERIRLQDKEIPILFLTAKNSGRDRVQGLKIGGDDYLTKPFLLEELLLRVQKLIGRREVVSEQSRTDCFTFGSNAIDFSSYEIQDKAGAMQRISQKEAKLLRLLVDKKNEVVSREEILSKVWGYDSYPSTRTIDNFILAFRKYFEEDPKNPKHFISVRGVGYRFVE